ATDGARQRADGAGQLGQHTRQRRLHAGDLALGLVEDAGQGAVALGGGARQGAVDGALQRPEGRVELRLGLVDGRVDRRLGGGDGGVGRRLGRRQCRLRLGGGQVRGVEGGGGDREGVVGVDLGQVQRVGHVTEDLADRVAGGGEGRR